jgi:hypothetical protein
MSRFKHLILKERNQYISYIILSIGIILFSAILNLSNPLPFQKFFGTLNPVLMVLLLFVLGIVVLTFLISNGLFEFYKRENLRRILPNSILAILLSFVVILIDIYITYPEDINVLLPQSLLFYPTMGYVVEILFHIVPLSILLILLTFVFKHVSLEKIIWLCIIITSMFEPIFQLIFGTPSEFPLWIQVIFVFQLYVFNFLQLHIFKRYDFFSMYSFRLVYYLFWHIIWGSIRLELLF